jgi:hypothetical protein
VWWLKPIILATEETGMGKIEVDIQLYLNQLKNGRGGICLSSQLLGKHEKEDQSDPVSKITKEHGWE